jgi:hypothetical protein
VRGAEGIVMRFSPRLVKPREPAALAQGPDAVAPAGEDLVGIGLVADVPDQAVDAASGRRGAGRR